MADNYANVIQAGGNGQVTGIGNVKQVRATPQSPINNSTPMIMLKDFMLTISSLASGCRRQ